MSGKKLKILQELSLEKVSISEDQEKKKKMIPAFLQARSEGEKW